ncbi:hypothetical protein P4U97_01345 [Bacillus swezeyi]|uniref:hypothetical protein n=1 Tax=Bacillus swezeyi TaxID=1925020 RepID=UPI002E1C5723|nr:hypothetical protein [Bacillus swezeyi]
MKLNEDHVDIPETGSSKELADRYIYKIENGFDLTSLELADYLNVTVRWIARHVRAEYILLNKQAKNALNMHYPNHPKTVLFVRNHKLFKRSDVFLFLTRTSHYCIGFDTERYPIELWPSKLLSPTRAVEQFQCQMKLLNNRVKEAQIKKYFITGTLPRYNETDLKQILPDYPKQK